MALWRIRATVDDRPGFLAVLAASLALRKVNILSVQVHATEAGAVDDFLVDAPEELTEADLHAAVVKGRGREPWIRRADADGLRDTPTLLINLATRLVDGAELASVLSALLGEVLVTRRPDTAGPVGADLSGGPAGADRAPAGADRAPAAADRAGGGFADGVMLLPDPDGGLLEVRRLEPPFTPAEYARACALVDLAAAVARQARRAG